MLREKLKIREKYLKVVLFLELKNNFLNNFIGICNQIK